MNDEYNDVAIREAVEQLWWENAAKEESRRYQQWARDYVAKWDDPYQRVLWDAS